MLQVWWELFDSESTMIGQITISELSSLNYQLEEAAEFHVLVGGTEIASGYSPTMLPHQISAIGYNAAEMANQAGLVGQVVIRGSKLALAQLLPQFLAIAN